MSYDPPWTLAVVLVILVVSLLEMHLIVPGLAEIGSR